MTFEFLFDENFQEFNLYQLMKDTEALLISQRLKFIIGVFRHFKPSLTCISEAIVTMTLSLVFTLYFMFNVYVVVKYMF